MYYDNNNQLLKEIGQTKVEVSVNNTDLHIYLVVFYLRSIFPTCSLIQAVRTCAPSSAILWFMFHCARKYASKCTPMLTVDLS